MDIYAAERIEKKRIYRGKVQYFVKWFGFSSKENTWEPQENIINRNLILDFESRNPSTSKSPNPSKRGRKPKGIIKKVDKTMPNLQQQRRETSVDSSGSKSVDSISIPMGENDSSCVVQNLQNLQNTEISMDSKMPKLESF